MLVYPRDINLTAVPACGLACLADGLFHTACAFTNQTCLCVEESYNDWVMSCVTSNCTIRNQLLTQRATSLGCGVAPTNDWHSFMVPEIIVFVLSTLFFSLRVANRASRMAPWSWDDTTCAISWVLCVLFLGIGITEVKLDASLSLWAKDFSRIDDALFVFFMSEVFYTLALGMVKASLLFLYTRIFPDRLFRRLVWATQVFNLALVVTCITADFFQCRPMSYFWQQWDREHQGTCFDVQAFAYTHSGINVGLDVWMLAIPASQVWKLNMALRWKLEATTMFAVGIFLTIATIIRFQSIAHFYTDPTDIQSYFPIAIWTVVELNIGVVAASMPAARLYAAKAATDLAQSSGWARFSSASHKPGSRPSYEDSSAPPSFTKRRSPARLAARLRLTLPSGLGGTQFARSVNRDLPRSEHEHEHEHDLEHEHEPPATACAAREDAPAPAPARGSDVELLDGLEWERRGAVGRGT